MSIYRKITISLVLILLALSTPNHTIADAMAAGEVTVQSGTLMRDGKAWIPEGVVLVGFAAPPVALEKKDARRPKVAELLGEVMEARKHYGPKMLDAIRQFGADVIRFQVSQPGLDPNSPIYSKAYVEDIIQGVKLARAHGFSVIVCLHHGRRSGMRQARLPDAATVRAWLNIAPAFSNDQGVIFNLFGEPGGVRENTPKNWERWRVATQPVVDAVRSTGAKNAILVDGIRGARILEGAPKLQDPVDRIIYGVHPYLGGGNNSPQKWDATFGNFADTHPVIASEWGAVSAWPSCNKLLPKRSEKLLAYLAKKKIGVIGWAFDVPGSLISDFSFAPTTLENLQCGQSGRNGVGQLLKLHFEQQ
jgi:endoglucanase